MAILNGEYLFIDKTTGIHAIARCYEAFGARSPIFTRAQTKAIVEDFNNDFEITGELICRYRDDEWALVDVGYKELEKVSCDIADFFDFEYMHDDAGEDDRWGINVEGLIEYLTEED